jgi:hypothetical protein
MKARRYVFILISLFLVVYLVLFALYYLVNPEQKYEFSMTNKKFSYTKDFSKSQFNKLKRNDYVLIFGTSQSHMISSKMMGANTLNFHNLYGQPGNILNFFKQLDKEQIKHIKQIIYLIDLRAGISNADRNFIDYSKTNGINFKITKTSMHNLFSDIKKNLSQNYKSYLKDDGSVYYINPEAHIGSINNYGSSSKARLRYSDELISGIVNIDVFSKKNNINVKYITPVVNDKYFRTIDLDNLSVFYSKLLKKNIQNLNLFYFIDGYSNLKNTDNDYIAFVEKDHLNQKFVEKWLYSYILKKNEFTINNEDELKTYFNTMKKIQENQLLL